LPSAANSLHHQPPLRFLFLIATLLRLQPMVPLPSSIFTPHLNLRSIRDEEAGLQVAHMTWWLESNDKTEALIDPL
ncbi:hypothetical protein Ancab_030060, partial [Ancistrocladus abbreviatus]